MIVIRPFFATCLMYSCLLLCLDARVPGCSRAGARWAGARRADPALSRDDRGRPRSAWRALQGRTGPDLYEVDATSFVDAGVAKDGVEQPDHVDRVATHIDRNV